MLKIPKRGFLVYTIGMKKKIILNLFVLSTILYATPAYAITLDEIQTKINEIKDQIAILSQGKLNISIETVPNTEDMVGIWDNFGPGKGRKGGATDWKWDLTFKNNGIKARTIKKITILHEPTGEGWSTDKERIYDFMNSYPLLIQGQNFKNTAYTSDLKLTILPGEKLNIKAFGQTEDGNYEEATARITFSDGKRLSIRIPPVNSSAILDF